MSALPEAAPPPARDASAPLLRVSGLTVGYRGSDGRAVRIVDEVSFTLARGEALGLAGESGCGKTTTALALLGLLPAGLERSAGEMVLEAREGTVQLHRRTERGMQQVRWRSISMIFQGAMNALDPVMRVSDQLAEAIRLHDPGADGRAVGKRIAELFDQVGISPGRARQYPHEFSGGMRQRVMIALALACSPEVVIADEPTTALDVMMQAQVLELLESLRRDLGLALILITHDLSVLAETCDRIAVMYAGQIAEQGSIAEVFAHPEHPYTQRMLRAYPAVGGPRSLSAPIPGLPPDPAALPPGCVFAPRCHAVQEVCTEAPVALREVRPRHDARCLFAPWPHEAPV
jgi:peptide/nickel transport system ATP-binding protein